MKIPELLAPIGSIEHLKVAIFSGASSIYLSGKKFGARQYAENLSLVEIKEAVKFAHLYNVKIYVTVNTLIKEEELLDTIEYLLDLYKIGVDAVIIQDIGLVKLIREIIPNLSIHGSTQMNIQNKEGIKWAVANGIKRVVLPRELNLSEVKELTNFAHENGVEVEIFIHGALCYSYSGRCLFSSFKGGRSGNRGTCAQPCRQKYQIAIKTKDKKSKTDKTLAISNEEYFLSTKDLSLFSEIERLENIGVDSLKIEGRMRNKGYVAIVVNSYRKLLNKLKYTKNPNFNKYDVEFRKKRKKYKKFKNNKSEKQIKSFKQEIDYKKAIENLKLVFNRELTTGHLLNQDPDEILNIENPGDNGLYIGKVDSFSKKTGEITISLESNLITIPEKGDGLLIEGKKIILNKNKKNKNNHGIITTKNNHTAISNKNNHDNVKNIYGLELSKDPILKEKSGAKNQKLIIKKVKGNKEINTEFDKNSKVYLTKRKAILDNTKKLLYDNSKQTIRRSRIFIQFNIGKSNYPILKGKIILANGKKIDTSKKSNVPWEIAKNKPITKEQLKKQLSKTGDIPLYIEKISINYKENLFAPISEINKLRREFFKDLESQIINSYLPAENEFKLAKNNLKKFKKIKDKKIIEYKEAIKTNVKSKKNQSMSENSLAIKTNVKSKKNQSMSENSLAIYLNDLNVLKSLNEKNNIYNRVYLEIPPKNQYLLFESNKDKEKGDKIDISYIVNFIKKAMFISKDQSYELIWKWPDIAHQDMIDDFTKALAILKKINMNINVMSGLLGIADFLKERFEIEVYGSYHLNVYNNQTILKLNEYKLLTISPELSKKDVNDLSKEYSKSKDSPEKSMQKYSKSKDSPEKSMQKYSKSKDSPEKSMQKYSKSKDSPESGINNLNKEYSKDYNKKSIATSNIQTIPDMEILVHGNVELLLSKNYLISKKLSKNFEKILKSKKYEKNKFNNNELFAILKNSKNNEFPIKKDINEKNRILLNSEDLCLINHIPYLKSIGFKNFAIDGRWKSIDYVKNIGTYYKEVINWDNSFKVELKNIEKVEDSYLNHVTEGNFIKGLKSE